MLIWMLLIYIGYRLVMSLAAGKKTELKSQKTAPAEATHCDPICGVYVSEDDAVVGTLDGRRHYFCSMACLDKFREKLDHTPT